MATRLALLISRRRSDADDRLRGRRAGRREAPVIISTSPVSSTARTLTRVRTRRLVDALLGTESPNAPASSEAHISDGPCRSRRAWRDAGAAASAPGAVAA